MVRKNPNRYEWKMPLELVFLGQSRYLLKKSPRKELKHFFDRAENKRSHRHTINVLKVESKEKRKVRY